MTILRIHTVQAFPASNLNRDDTGSPKSQVFGGTRRLRVSSQCKKSSVRKHFADKGTDRLVSIRTLSSPQLVLNRVLEINPGVDAAKARELIASAMGVKPNEKDTEAFKTSALFSVSELQIDAAAKIVSDAVNDGSALDKKAYKKEFLAALSDLSSVDQVLFGRFYASDSTLTIDAACQVAHALGTCAMPEGSDYFTGRDEIGSITNKDDADENAGAGAGHVGIKEFSSGPLYFYTTVDVDGLVAGLGGDTALAVNALAEYVDSFVRSIPSGSQNAYAADTPPTTVLVEIADNGAGVSYAGAFESHSNTSDIASSRMVSHASRLHAGYGTSPDASFLFSISDDVDTPAWSTRVDSLGDIVNGVRESVAERLGVK
ncbi:MAG: type I-E CRISPR-associated protein Cas7/Cse4/CasC [Corynebacterium casei]